MGAGSIIVNGTIESNEIKAAHENIKKIVDAYGEAHREVSEITQKVKENWVGRGRNEFESQYRLLISKISDFGDTLVDIYDALVEAEASYQDVDWDLKQDYRAAIED